MSEIEAGKHRREGCLVGLLACVLSTAFMILMIFVAAKVMLP